MLKKPLTDGFLAGLMIAIGGSVFLSCEARWVGAVFFSVALLCICYFGFSLYTGKVGFLAQDASPRALAEVYLGLLGNLLGTLVFGRLAALALPALSEAAHALCLGKLEQTALQTLLRALFCGVLMYAAVWIFREKHTIAGILFCVPVFILAGFEHSIADLFYFFLAGLFSGKAALFLLLAVAGNTLGGLLIPLLRRLAGERSAS